MMTRNLARWAVGLAFWGASSLGHASFHLFQITQLFSNADGTVQFIELQALAGGQQFLTGHSIGTSQGGSSHSYVFTSDLPGDTAGKSLLIATQGFAALNVVTPDYVVPNGFLFLPNGSVDWGPGYDIWPYPPLPTDGLRARFRDGTVGIN